MEIESEAGCSRPKVRENDFIETVNKLISIHREFQMFLAGYLIISLCEIFTVGGLPMGSPLQQRVVLVGTLLYWCGSYRLIKRPGVYCRPSWCNYRDALGSHA